MNETENQTLKNILSRHEVLKSRLECSNMFWMPFRHDVSKNLICFYGVENITQHLIRHEKHMFDAF